MYITGKVIMSGNPETAMHEGRSWVKQSFSFIYTDQQSKADELVAAQVSLPADHKGYVMPPGSKVSCRVSSLKQNYGGFLELRTNEVIV